MKNPTIENQLFTVDMFNGIKPESKTQSQQKPADYHYMFEPIDGPVNKHSFGNQEQGLMN